MDFQCDAPFESQEPIFLFHKFCFIILFAAKCVHTFQSSDIMAHEQSHDCLPLRNCKLP